MSKVDAIMPNDLTHSLLDEMRCFMTIVAWRQFGHTTKVTMLKNQMVYITIGKIYKLEQSWFNVAVKKEWDIW